VLFLPCVLCSPPYRRSIWVPNTSGLPVPPVFRVGACASLFTFFLSLTSPLQGTLPRTHVILFPGTFLGLKTPISPSVSGAHPAQWGLLPFLSRTSFHTHGVFFIICISFGNFPPGLFTHSSFCPNRLLLRCVLVGWVRALWSPAVLSCPLGFSFFSLSALIFFTKVCV